jgi:hypothetical protein
MLYMLRLFDGLKFCMGGQLPAVGASIESHRTDSGCRVTNEAIEARASQLNRRAKTRV